METKVTSASVKVMLSYDYSHFEASMQLGNDNGVTTAEIDAARKTCQRLADKAVAQYKTYKENAARRSDARFHIESFENTCKRILLKPEGERTVNEMAMLKQYQDENWRAQFDYDYDYDDDNNYSL